MKKSCANCVNGETEFCKIDSGVKCSVQFFCEKHEKDWRYAPECPICGKDMFCDVLNVQMNKVGLSCPDHNLIFDLEILHNKFNFDHLRSACIKAYELFYAD